MLAEMFFERYCMLAEMFFLGKFGGKHGEHAASPAQMTAGGVWAKLRRIVPSEEDRLKQRPGLIGVSRGLQRGCCCPRR